MFDNLTAFKPDFYYFYLFGYNNLLYFYICENVLVYLSETFFFCYFYIKDFIMKWFLDNSFYFVWIGFIMFVTGVFIDSAFLFITGIMGFYVGIMSEEFPYLFEKKRKADTDDKKI